MDHRALAGLDICGAMQVQCGMSVSAQEVRNRHEDRLRRHLLQRRVLEVRVPGRPQERLRVKLTNQEVSPRTIAGFAEIPTLLGPLVTGTSQHPKRFDLVGRPTYPRRARAVIVELKAGKLSHQDLRQLLAYITFVRYYQKHGGPKGLGLLSEAFQFCVTRRTKVSGLLIGRAVLPGLMEWIPDEIWESIRVCTFRVSEGRWPGSYRKVQVYDRGYPFRHQREREGKLLRRALNPS